MAVPRQAGTVGELGGIAKQGGVFTNFSANCPNVEGRARGGLDQLAAVNYTYLY